MRVCVMLVRVSHIGLARARVCLVGTGVCVFGRLIRVGTCVCLFVDTSRSYVGLVRACVCLAGTIMLCYMCGWYI